MEESISKAAGANFGEFVEPAEFRRMIRSIGRTPAERTTSYKIRRTFDAAGNDDSIEPSPTPTADSSPFSLLNASDTQQTHHVTHGESAY
jgi:FO synthase subunit 2